MTTPTLHDRMKTLDEALRDAVVAAEAAHSEARRMHREYLSSDPPMLAAGQSAWCAIGYLGEILGELRTIRGRI